MSNSAKQPLRVFLCHTNADKTTVRALYKKLIDDGIDAWLDEEKLLAGKKWQVEIPKALRNSDVVIVCISKKSINKEGYVQREIKTALDAAEEKLDSTIFIIPARLENCAVPDRLSIYQYVDLFSRGGYEKLLAALSARAEQSKAVLPNHRSSNLLQRVYTKPASLNPKSSNLQIMRFSIVLLGIVIFALSLWGTLKLIQPTTNIFPGKTYIPSQAFIEALTPVTPPTPTPTLTETQIALQPPAGSVTSKLEIRNSTHLPIHMQLVLHTNPEKGYLLTVPAGESNTFQITANIYSAQVEVCGVRQTWGRFDLKKNISISFPPCVDMTPLISPTP